MTDLERLAREAGMRPYQDQAPGIDGAVGDWEALARFAALVRADERERCAKVCENRAADNWDHEGGALACAAAIRALPR